VSECYTIKARLVTLDEFDKKDIRAVLNYGHTIGHAVEAASQYAYRHGEAVSIGIACANDVAVKLGLLNKDVAARIEHLLTRIGLPVSIKNCRIDDIMRHFWRDKKFVNGQNKLILATGIGTTTIRKGIPEGAIVSVIKHRSAQGR
jgi:3-dehydroquinate synthase